MKDIVIIINTVSAPLVRVLLDGRTDTTENTKIIDRTGLSRACFAAAAS
jgi:hypothetical protein